MYYNTSLSLVILPLPEVSRSVMFNLGVMALGRRMGAVQFALLSPPVFPGDHIKKGFRH
jgi:hypothetical protein